MSEWKVGDIVCSAAYKENFIYEIVSLFERDNHDRVLLKVLWRSETERRFSVGEIRDTYALVIKPGPNEMTILALASEGKINV